MKNFLICYTKKYLPNFMSKFFLLTSLITIFCLAVFFIYKLKKNKKDEKKKLIKDDIYPLY